MTSPDANRIRLRLDQWKRQLIDLTRRNRLLNHKPGKASSVGFIDVNPVSVFDDLVSESKLAFAPLPDPDDAEAPPEVSADCLQTDLPRKRLSKNLLNLYRRSVESLEEQGVNTLYMAFGMLKWFEDENSDVSSRAPLLLVAVELQRTEASNQFTVSAADGDPILNPAIIEKLRLDFRVSVPELPDVVDDLILESVLQTVRDAVSNLKRWEVSDEVVLGLFSFQKFIMYKDIENNGPRFEEHRLIRAVCRVEGSSGVTGLPEDIKTAALDEDMPPWKSVQVMDADSSQQRAMLAVRKGHDLVIEGPPGTGKSQTIANVIADALAEGRTVLFVSEKMAALQVVRSRLETAQLGSFILELHSNKASKKEFVRELSTALDAVETGQEADPSELATLRRITGELNSYVVELHRPEQPLGVSPYQAIGHLSEVEEAPTVLLNLEGLGEVDSDTFRKARSLLAEVARINAAVGDPGSHALRGFGVLHPSRADQERLEASIRMARERLAELWQTLEHLVQDLGLQAPETLGEVELTLEGARAVANTPGAETSVLSNPQWNSLSADVRGLLDLGRSFRDRRKQVQACFTAEILDEDLTEPTQVFAAHVERGAWRVLFPSYWKTRRQLRHFLLPTHRPSSSRQLLDEVQEAQKCRLERDELISRDSFGRNLFGARWKGPLSDWSDLADFAEWVSQLRQFVLQEILTEKGLEVAASGDLSKEAAQEAIKRVDQALASLRTALQQLATDAHLSEDSDLRPSPTSNITSLRHRLAEAEAELGELRAWGAYVAARTGALDFQLTRDFLLATEAAAIAPEELRSSFERRFWTSWLDSVVTQRPTLQRFQSAGHEGKIERFRELDQASLKLATQRTIAALTDRRRGLVSGDLSDELRLLQREARKQRRIMPIRKLLKRAPRATALVKPCFMMSPLSVAQFLEPGGLQFDLLVFDEASQIPPADAIGAIVRAAQAVVVGDSKQLPPTNFFGVHLDEADMDEEEEVEIIEDLESILDEVAVAGVPSTRLKWHYRSEHQSLIRFSNEEFYEDDPLYVFPSAVDDDEVLGLRLELVEDGVYVGKGQNPVEAKRVADAVVEHIKTFPGLSLGVGTFGIAQQNVILDELDDRRRKDSSIEWFFHQDGEQKFFVKNLENIQGDDRDVIFLSVTYGPDANGLIRRNFGPINKAGGWRRLNVLTTRAKRHLRVFSSMRGSDIDAEGIAEGARLLRQYLTFAETGEYPAPGGPGGEPDSPFERSVIRALKERGYRVHPQVGDSGYRVDIGVVDPDAPGRYICGIECDGASYHSAATARDRDRLRQQVLENRGWYIHRIWSTDWFHDPHRQISRIVDLIEDSRQRGPRRRHEIVNPPVEAPPSSQSPEEWPPEQAPTPPGTSLAEIEVPLYCFADITAVDSPEQFYDCPIREVASVAERVIELEGPVHMMEVARRTAAAWGLQRAKGRIQARVQKACDILLPNGSIVAEGEFLWTSDLDPIPVRSRALDDVNFKSDTVAPKEIEEAIRLLLRHRAPLLPDDLVKETARVLGFRRTSQDFQDRILEARERLSHGGELRAGGTGLYLVEEL